MNNEYVAVKKETLKSIIGFVSNLYDCIDFDSEEVQEHEIENGWDDYIQPIVDIVDGSSNEVGDSILAKDVDIKLFKEQLSDIYDYDISNLSDKEITKLYDDVQECLANDDVYSEIYNEVVQKIFEEHSSLDSVIRSCEEMSKGSVKAVAQKDLCQDER